MIEAYFNELSMEPLCSTNDEVELRIQTFATLLKELNKNNIKTVRYENSFSDIKLKQNLTLHDYCLSSYNYNRDIVNLLYSTMKRPYLSEEQDRDFYTYDDVKFVSAQNTEHNCIGLYIAKLKNTFAIGFNAGLFKDKLDVSYTLKLKKADNKMTLIIITHNMEEVLLTNRVLVLKDQKISYDGKPDDLFKNEELLKTLNINPPFKYELVTKLKKAGFKVDFNDSLKSIKDKIWQ